MSPLSEHQFLLRVSRDHLIDLLMVNTQMTPVLLDSETGIGEAISIWLCMPFAVSLFIFAWKKMPETRQKMLEEIGKSWEMK